MQYNQPPTPTTHTEKVCIVSNKKDFDRDYSDFVDSCDRIIRISKMDNLDSGLTGKRIDIVLVSCFAGYLAFSEKQRHMDALRTASEIYFNNEQIACSRTFAERECLANWKFMPAEVHAATTNFTTLSKGLCLADYLFPDAQLYYLGDADMRVRTPRDPKHNQKIENAYMQALIDKGRLIPILNDESYSSEIRPNI